MPRGSNLYRRGRIWWARVQIAGRDLRRSLRTSDRALAQKRLIAIMKDAERIRFGEEGRHAYREAVLAWVQSGFGGVKPSSAQRYRASLRMLHSGFSELYLDQIDARAIGRYVRERKLNGASNATVRRDLSALSRLIAHANAMGWGEHNPARNWDRSVIRETRYLIERVDAASYRAVLEKCAPMFAAYVSFLLATGLRAGEAAAIRRANLDWSGRRVTINGKRGMRTVELSRQAVEIAQSVPLSLNSQFLFWAPHGGAYSDPSQRFAAARQAAQKAAHRDAAPFQPFRLHDLRHEYAIRWLEAGESIYRLQQHLGHSSVKTTEIYCAFLTPEQAAMSKGLAQKPAQAKRIASASALTTNAESSDR